MITDSPEGDRSRLGLRTTSRIDRVGLEPTTSRLRIECSEPTELPINIEYVVVNVRSACLIVFFKLLYHTSIYFVNIFYVLKFNFFCRSAWFRQIIKL